VASQRYIPWAGNAINWWTNAQTYGEPEGQVPVVGAIAVFDNGYDGHVGFVTKVLSNGSWEQTEMNVDGLGSRTPGPSARPSATSSASSTELLAAAGGARA